MLSDYILYTSYIFVMQHNLRFSFLIRSDPRNRSGRRKLRFGRQTSGIRHQSYVNADCRPFKIASAHKRI